MRNTNQLPWAKPEQERLTLLDVQLYCGGQSKVLIKKARLYQIDRVQKLCVDKNLCPMTAALSGERAGGQLLGVPAVHHGNKRRQTLAMDFSHSGITCLSVSFDLIYEHFLQAC